MFVNLVVVIYLYNVNESTNGKKNKILLRSCLDSRHSHSELRAHAQLRLSRLVNWGGCSPKLKGAIWRGGTKNMMKFERAEGVRKVLGLSSGNSLGFLLKKRLSSSLPRIQKGAFKRECIWVRIRGAVLAKSEGHFTYWKKRTRFFQNKRI